MKSNLLSKIVISAMVCGSLFAANNVKMATDGTGDFLMAPFYEAKDDVCTEIKVFNTNETSSVLAKVSIREQVSSQEVDLPIFLSPGDVWSGTVCEHNGKTVLTSVDDSNHPYIIDVLKNGKYLENQSIAAGHKNVDFRRGYVEIYPIAQFDEGSNAKVEKPILHKRWDELIEGNTKIAKLRKKGVDENSISGIVSYQTNEKETSSFSMVAFENTHSKQRTGSSIMYAEDTSPEVLLGQDEKVQILELLQNSTVSFTYDNFGKDQYVYLTFPFGYTLGQQRSFEVVVRDMEENKDIKKVIFSPRMNKRYVIKNELVVMSVSEILSMTMDSSKYEKGMIQIKEIKNIGSHQLGSGAYASFIPSVVSTIKNSDRFINSVASAPVK